MKIAIYSIWDGEELLKYSIDSIRSGIDKIISVTQLKSNHGVFYSGGHDKAVELLKMGLIDEIIEYEPNLKYNPMRNEKIKRSKGLEVAKQMGGNYYMMMDCDEMWLKVPKPNQAHQMKTFFKYPTLQYETYENYHVAGLIELNSSSKIGGSCGFWVDPTRTPNRKLTLGSEIMHHYSYVRTDINRKIENSSAKSNIFAKNKQLKTDYEKACNGYELGFTDNKLVSVPNYFNIEIPICKSVQGVNEATANRK